MSGEIKLEKVLYSSLESLEEHYSTDGPQYSPLFVKIDESHAQIISKKHHGAIVEVRSGTEVLRFVRS